MLVIGVLTGLVYIATIMVEEQVKKEDEVHE